MRSALLLFVAIAVICGREAAADDIYPRILNGQPVHEFAEGAYEDDFEPVGIVGSQLRGGFCSGTLISPEHVLTAAHCAEVIEGQTAGRFQVGGRVYSTVQIHIHPQYNPNTLANDIAILELSEPVMDVVPALLYRQTPSVGQQVLIVGFGQGGTATEADGTFGTKAAGSTRIDSVTDALVIWDFDDPTESNTAPGDSGGPGFIEVDGELFIACVTSGGTVEDGLLGDMAFNTRVDAFASWIDGITGFSNEPPMDDPIEDEPIEDDPVEDNPPSGDPEEEMEPDRPQYCPPWMQNRPQRPGRKPGWRRPPNRKPQYKPSRKPQRKPSRRPALRGLRAVISTLSHRATSRGTRNGRSRR